MGLFSSPKHTENDSEANGNTQGQIHVSSDSVKELGGYDDTPVKFLTLRSLLMGVLVSMGGFIFGYDTGTSSPMTQ